MRHWILAFDFSDCARHALDHAGAMLAAMGDGALEILHVHEPNALPEGGIDIGAVGAGPEYEQRQEQQVQHELDAILAQQRALRPSVAFSARLVHGAAVDTIVARAKEMQVDQLVIASHGRRGLARVMLGSVAEQVTRKADCSVLIVKHPS